MRIIMSRERAERLGLSKRGYALKTVSASAQFQLPDKEDAKILQKVLGYKVDYTKQEKSE